MQNDTEHQEHTLVSKGLELDLSDQARLAQINKKLERRIFNLLKEVSLEVIKKKKRHKGALIVLGEFVRCNYKIAGMRQFKSNPLEGTALFLGDKAAKEKLKELFNEDGAILIDSSGQVLAARVYLQVDHPAVTVDEECSTRHLSAASCSQEPYVIACFTLSEETGKVRHYIGGVQEEVFDPYENKNDEDEDEETE